MDIVETKKLTRKFGSFTAVDSLDINIAAGDAFALLGPNGAGKTTVIKMLTRFFPLPQVMRSFADQHHYSAE